jgi:hypothetical protein
MGTEFANQLPTPLLRKVFETRLAECQQLSFKDFKTECKSVMSYPDSSDIGEMAALLAFVKPSEIKQCQKRHIECGKVTKRFNTLRGLELVDMVRFLWKWDLFDQETR